MRGALSTWRRDAPPPTSHEHRPERKDRRPGLPERMFGFVSGGATRLWRASRLNPRGFAEKVNAFADEVSRMDGEAIKCDARRLGLELRRDGFRGRNAARMFALVREAADRTIGMRHFDTQLMGGWALLNGTVAEMETGEGKTLTVTLAASAAALAGMPVHVITVNDYLTRRDAELLRPVYGALGLSVGVVTHDVPLAARREAYRCDVTYCTNKEITFDYLRDSMTLGGVSDPLRLQAEHIYTRDTRSNRLLLRGLHFAVVDEADSLLIDEARTPLIISGPRAGVGEDAAVCEAMRLAGALDEGTDFVVDRDSRTVALTGEGREKAARQALGMGSFWSAALRRNVLLEKALQAMHLYQRDVHYLVSDGKVQIVDEYTGRVMHDRSWEQGLHQMIEAKEGCRLSRPPETLARISFQRFFRRYLRLSGMTGTAWEVRGEMWSVYGLPVVRIPTNMRLIRVMHPDSVFASADEKWRAVLERVRNLNAQGRPVLVGTRTVASSERISGILSEAGLDHQVLNAKQDREEAEVVARAGEAGCITIATNMAGRGTDIKLGNGVPARGGLHVMLTERHEAARIDRQLAGRCARQGDPGSFEAVLSLEDPIVEGGRGGIMHWAASRLFREGSSMWSWAARRAIIRAQNKMERIHKGIRRDLFTSDMRRIDLLSFSGRPE